MKREIYQGWQHAGEKQNMVMQKPQSEKEGGNKGPWPILHQTPLEYNQTKNANVQGNPKQDPVKSTS